ncbi:hypothetical protein P0D91_33175 [Pseudomonas sp. CBSPBW29]|uniref:hypothetical protein n=1 Tax=Pseudomonas TaxID=286 RepID=UPI0021ABAF97|nr:MULTISPECIES: hypothetical protein [unclassified Pseudomonas]WEL42775.1 hypothetical protein P0D91_33175 [Pseudomonas sp. CBSPBW29]WEL63848.1 hypothetical protein P0D93_27365 [Pseudomonas sp. CBSPGW29]WEL73036.1 hypothetical protein P0D94_13280 [Pseudomonas sp. CBSPCGW29]WEL74349.1 hypothetical protein P0D92_19325 [Pseudomonas sp. CBSPAW29]WEL81421.1 hypothetical protein P0D95_26505 [Pseudomonas sp. CBSPCAW29]
MSVEHYAEWAGPLQGYTADDYLYGMQGPWPKANTLAGELPAMIKRVPKAQIDDFRIDVVSHYLKTLKVGRVKILLKMLAGDYKLRPVSDLLFAQQLFYGTLSKLLTPVHTEDAREFPGLLNSDDLFDSHGEPKYLKIDTVSMNRWDPLHGIHSAPSLTLFKRDSNNSGTVLAIKTNGLVLTPDDKNAWELAKYFVLQGALCLTTLLTHPRLHFPVDTISAISLTALPKEHLLFKLLAPHTRIQLAINQAVSLQPYSVAHNNQFLPYTPYPGWGNVPVIDEGRGWTGLMTDAFSGIEGNSSYPPYTFPLVPEKIWSDFDDFIRGYYDVIFDFVSAATSYIDVDDPVITYWSDAIAAWVTGFPAHQRLREGDTFARAIAYFIWDVTVAHSADHGAMGHYQQNIFPLRLRVPAPSSKTIPPINRRKLVTFGDTLRNRLCFKMYFGPPQGTQHLHDTWYGFGIAELDELNKRFLRELKRFDEGITGRRFIALKDIASSINF